MARPIDPVTGFHVGPAHDRITLRDVALSVALLVHPTKTVVALATAPTKENQMFKPEIDPHAWPTASRSGLRNLLHRSSQPAKRETVLTDLERVPNPEPQRVVVVAGFDPDAPAMTERPTGPRRPGIAVPAMPRLDAVPSGHVDAMANVHSWDR